MNEISEGGLIWLLIKKLRAQPSMVGLTLGLASPGQPLPSPRGVKPKREEWGERGMHGEKGGGEMRPPSPLGGRGVASCARDVIISVSLLHCQLVVGKSLC